MAKGKTTEPLRGDEAGFCHTTESPRLRLDVRRCTTKHNLWDLAPSTETCLTHLPHFPSHQAMVQSGYLSHVQLINPDEK